MKYTLLLLWISAVSGASKASMLVFKKDSTNCSIALANSTTKLHSTCDLRLPSGASIQSNSDAVTTLQTKLDELETDNIAALQAKLNQLEVKLDNKIANDVDRVESAVARLQDTVGRMLGCEDGKYANDKFTSMANRCLPCHADCHHCSGPDYNTCTKCANDKILRDNKCYDPCTCTSGTAAIGQACAAAQDSTGDVHQCTSCPDGFFLYKSRCHRSCTCANGQAHADGQRCVDARGKAGGVEQCASCNKDYAIKDSTCELTVRSSCMDYYNAGVRESGPRMVLNGSGKRMVYCRMSDGGGWTLVVAIPGNSQAHSNTGCTGKGCSDPLTTYIGPHDYGSKYSDSYIRSIRSGVSGANIRFACASNVQYFRGCSFHATRHSRSHGGCTVSYNGPGASSSVRSSESGCNAGSQALGCHHGGSCGRTDNYCRHCARGPWHITNTGGCGHDCNGNGRQGHVWVR